jgi:hypothetical protein
MPLLGGSCGSSQQVARPVTSDGRPLALAVGLALDDKLPSRALEPVDGGLGEQGVGEHAGPFNRLPVGSQDRRGGLMPFHHKLIEVRGLGRVEALQCEIIDLLRDPDKSMTS